MTDNITTNPGLRGRSVSVVVVANISFQSAERVTEVLITSRKIAMSLEIITKLFVEGSTFQFGVGARRFLWFLL